jgi:hypothetical protein
MHKPSAIELIKKQMQLPITFFFTHTEIIPLKNKIPTPINKGVQAFSNGIVLNKFSNNEHKDKNKNDIIEIKVIFFIMISP